MPWYVNITRSVIRAIDANGEHVGFGPRKRAFVLASKMSDDIQKYINNKQLRYDGSGQDLEPVIETVPGLAVAPEEIEVIVEPVIEDRIIELDEEGEMLAISDIEEQLDTVSGDDVAPDRNRRKRRKRS